MIPRLVVCAAIRNETANEIVCGARHGNCLNTIVQYGFDSKDWECGFIDQKNTFMTRAEAWKVADAAGQIRRPNGWEKDYDSIRPASVGDEGLLFSENLY
jgi:hypothetical protein